MQSCECYIHCIQQIAGFDTNVYKEEKIKFGWLSIWELIHHIFTEKSFWYVWGNKQTNFDMYSVIFDIKGNYQRTSNFPCKKGMRERRELIIFVKNAIFMTIGQSKIPN